MAMVDVRAIKVALRERFLAIPDLPVVQYQDQPMPEDVGDKIWVREQLFPGTNEQLGFGVDFARGSMVYTTIAPANQPKLIEEAYDFAHEVLEAFEHGTRYVDSAGTPVTIFRSQTGQAGRGRGELSEFLLVPTVIKWWSSAQLTS